MKSSKISENLKKFNIKVEIREISDNTQLEEVFMKISDLNNLYKKDNTTYLF